MALQNVDILKVMESDSGQAMQVLKVDGGASANDLLMQLQADYLGRPITRPEVIETTVAGACFLAGLGERIWDSPEALSNVWRAEKVFEVGLGPEQRQQRLASWQSAVSKTLHT